MFYKMFTNKITYPKTTINNEDMKNVINFDYLSAITVAAVQKKSESDWP